MSLNPIVTVIGMKHQKIWKIRDLLGRIVDSLLPLQAHEPFPPDCFPLIDFHPDGTGYEIHNPEGTFKFVFNVEGSIFTLDHRAYPKITMQDMQAMYIKLTEAIASHGVQHRLLLRMGVLSTFEVDLDPTEFASLLLREPPAGEATDIKLKIAVLHPCEDRNSSSFYKAIIGIRSGLIGSGERSSLIDIDFQEFFQEKDFKVTEAYVEDLMKTATRFSETFLSSRFHMVLDQIHA